MMQIEPTAHETGARTLGILQLFADRSLATTIHASPAATGSPQRDFSSKCFEIAGSKATLNACAYATFSLNFGQLRALGSWSILTENFFQASGQRPKPIERPYRTKGNGMHRYSFAQGADLFL